MKWIILSSIIALLSACGYYRNSVEYSTFTYRPVVAPAYYDPVGYAYDSSPFDVTTIDLNYY